MGLLSEAKKESKGKDEKPKKHRKHPASAPPASVEQDGDEGGEDQAAEASEPEADAEPDDAGPSGQGDSAGASQPPQDVQDQQGGDDGGDAEQSQQGAQGDGEAQGPTPVPNPAAPGAGDTSGGDDTPGQDQGPEVPGENTAAGPGSTNSLPQVPMSPGLQEEYDRANQALMQALYSMPGDKLATSILQSLWPQGPGKIKGIIVSSLMLLTQLHKKLNLPPQLVLPFTKDVVAHIMDLGQQVKQIQYSDQEATAILGGAYEGALRIFGVNKGQAARATQLLGRKQIEAHQAMYKQAHAHAKQAIDQNNQQWHHPHLAPGQGPSGGQPGPQTGAPANAQTPPSTPPPGANAPPAGAPPASGGGMLTQAAAQGGAGG